LSIALYRLQFPPDVLPVLTLGKVSKRILARRLGYLAETTDLLYPSQLGGYRKKSTIDVAFLLIDKV